MPLSGPQRISDLEEVSSLQAQDQFVFFQSSTQSTKRVSRQNLVLSNGFISSMPGVVTNDGVPPNVPTGLTVTTINEKDADGTEKVYIKAELVGAQTQPADFAAYRWYIRRVSGTPTFSGGVLTGYSEAQIFGPTITQTPKTDANATKMTWDVRANKYYEVAVAAVDTNGNASAYTTLTNSTVILSAKDTSPPNAPTAVSATSAIKSVFLSWTNPTDSDLAFIKIYRVQTDTATVPSVPTIGPAQAGYARIMSNSYVDSNTIQGKYYHYWLTSVDDSGNESGTPSTVVSISPGLVANTDIATFAVDATKMFTNTVILKGDVWTDNSPSAGYIAWNAHTLVYGGASYSISAGNTNQQFVYWTGGTTYSTSNTNPTLTDGQFMIATNAKDSNGNPTGLHDLAWNAIANAVIGSAYIQNAAITNAKVNDLAVDKLTSGSISAQVISLIGDSVIKSSSATSIDTGAGLWIKGLAGGGSEFGIGDLAGTNYGFLKWKTSNNTLSIKGAINATSLLLNGVGLTGSDVGLGNVSNLSPVNQTTNGLQATVTINSGGIAMGSGGFVRGGINWETANNRFTTSTSGFFLGYTTATAPTANAYRFFIGDTGSDGLGTGADNLYWTGSGLVINGTLSGNIKSGTLFGTIGDNTVGLTIQSGKGLRYYTNAGVLTITGGSDNGAANGAQIDLAGNTWENVNRGSLVLSAGKPTFPNATFTGTISGTTLTVSGVTNTILVGMTVTGTGVSANTIITGKTNATTYTVTPSQTVGSVSMTGNAGLAPGSIHFRTNDELVGLWRANKTFDIYSTVVMSGDLYVGSIDPAQSPFKVVSGAVTATGITLSGGVVSGTTRIGGASGVLASVIDSTVSDDGNIVTPNFDTASKIILDSFTFGTKGGQDFISAIKVGTLTWNASTGAIDSGAGKTGIVIYKGGIIAVKDGVPTFSLNGSTGDATFAGSLSAATGSFTGTLSVGTANTIFKVNADGSIHSGHANFASAPFSVTNAGLLKATSGYFGTSATNGVKIDSAGLEVIGSGATDNVGRIMGAIDWTNSPAQFTPNTSGFYLGRASNAYRFFIGQTGGTGTGGTSYLYWNGSTLTINGDILGTSTISGTTASTVVTNASNGNTAFNTLSSKLDKQATYILGNGTGNTFALKTTNFDTGTGVAITENGLICKKANVNTVTIDNNGDASFAGTVNATAGYFGTSATNGVKVDSSGLEVLGSGAADNVGRIKAAIDWDASNARFTGSSGFYLGRASNVYRFFIGSTGNPGVGSGNYLYWDGSTLKIGGNIVGGTTVGTVGDSGAGLTINSSYGIRQGSATNAGVLTITGGNANGIQSGAQIDLCGSSYSPAAGVLILQAGSGSGSQIRFSTNTVDNQQTTQTGVVRAIIKSDGLFEIQRNVGSQVSGNGATLINANAGNLYVYSNVGIGMAPDQTNTAGATDENIRGKLWVSTEVVLYNSTTPKLTLTASNGNVSSAGDVSAVSFTTSSSKKVKTNIKKLKSGLETIDKLKPVSFKRKGTKQQDIGLIAEEVDKVIPIIVKHNDKNEAEGLDYSKLTVLLINAVKELSAEVKRLEKKIKDANSN